ncbi:MAG: Holliday junction resolvase RuvX [Candidatus Pacebacteria bacterium]|nr:Holliday junction resolvase RuvX [Candidatus Paceibacterota bacterium]
MSQSKILAIDYGTKRLGIAVSHASLAEPLKVIANDNQVFDRLVELCKQLQVEQVIVGLSENQMAAKTKAFVKQLAQVLPGELRPQLVDETLTSQEVRRRLQQQGIKYKKRQGSIDHYAAALILTDYLAHPVAKEIPLTED